MNPQHLSCNFSSQSWGGQILRKDNMNYDEVTATRAPTGWEGECMEFQFSDQSTNSRYSRTSNANTPASTPPTDMSSYGEASPIQNIRKFVHFEDEYPPPNLSLSPDFQGVSSTNNHAYSSPIQSIGKFEPFENEYPGPHPSLSPDLQGIYGTNDHAYSSDPGGTSRATPTTLGWMPDTQLPKLYTFVLKKDEQYLELKPGYDVTEETPQRVYLDKDE